MTAKQPESGGGGKGRSAAQRQGSAAMTEVMRAWEALTDMERLTWDVAGKSRRRSGVNYFKQVNLRRLRRGEELARVPTPFKPSDGRPLLKGLSIRNRGGRITLVLELRRGPDAPRTVWASLPCNLGLKKPRECPRLGWLPAPQARRSEITRLYFTKHGEHIRQHGLQLVGKRIFVRLRLERDDGVLLYEQARTVVPKPEVEMGKKGPSSSKEVRRGFEGGSKELRNITCTPRVPQALHTRAGGGRWRRGRRIPKPSSRSLK